MKIDFSIVIKQASGDPMMDGTDQATLGGCAFKALIQDYVSEKGITAEKKFQRGKLAELAYRKEVAEVAAKDVATIKEVIGLAYNPWIVLQCYRAIEGSDIDAQGEKHD